MNDIINITAEVPAELELSQIRRRVSAILDSAAEALKAATEPVSVWCARAGGVLIFVMTALVAADFFLRSLFGTTITWVMEIETFAMAVVVFLGITYTQYKEGHVSVDMLSTRFSARTRVITESYGISMGILLFVMIAVEHVTKIKIALATNEAGILTEWPLWPFYAVLVFGAALTVCAFVAKLLALQAELWRVYKQPVAVTLVLAALVAATILLPEILKAIGIKMTVLMAGTTGTILLMALMAIGTPIAFAMGFIGIIGCWYLRDFAAMAQVVQMTVFSTVGDYFFTVIPFFVGMGFLCFAADFSKNLYDAAYKAFGTLKGGLAISTVFGCAGFASICGDSMATAATMGSVALPEMKKAKYDMALACGSLAAGGTLGILIPPSIGFIVYGIITEQSVGKLFIAGILPGIVLALIFCAIIWVRCALKPSIGPSGPTNTLRDKLTAIRDTWPILILFLLVMGGIWLGAFTATEGGAIGFFAAFLIGLGMGRFTWKGLQAAMMETMLVTAMIFTILLGVTILNYFIGMSEVPLVLADMVKNTGLPRVIVFAIIMLIYVVLGMLMNIIPMIMLTLPLIFPTILALGFDPIWFGVIMVIMMEMGQITPPVGVNVYVITGVAKDVPMGTVFRGVIPFIFAQVLMVVILYIFPIIATYLPSMMTVLKEIAD